MIPLLILASIMTAHFGRVSEVQGEAYLLAEETQPLLPNFLIEPGDLVETQDGRVEVELSYGTVVWIGHDSKVWFHEISEERRVLEVVKGRVYVRNRTEDSDVLLQVPQGFLRIRGDGAVRLRVQKNGFVYARVTDGRLEVDTDEASTVLHEGESLELDPFGYITYRSYAFDDDFYRWCHRRERIYVTVEVVPYVPSGIWIGLVDLSLHGRWIWLSPYGWVWVPRTIVAASWRPYLYGHWVFYVDIGWVWVSYEPWGWVPYHYGRWVHVPGHGWVWIPGGTFRGGWVAWHTYDGVVAWAPLGPNDRPARVGKQTAWIAVSRNSFLHPRIPHGVDLTKHPVVPYKEVRLARVPDRSWSHELHLSPASGSRNIVKGKPLLRAKAPDQRALTSHRSSRHQEKGVLQPSPTVRGTRDRKVEARSKARVQDRRYRQPSRTVESGLRILPREDSRLRTRSERPRVSVRKTEDHRWIRRSFESVLKRTPKDRKSSKGKSKKVPVRTPKDDKRKLPKLPSSLFKAPSGR